MTLNEVVEVLMQVGFTRREATEPLLVRKPPTPAEVESIKREVAELLAARRARAA